MTKLQKEGMAPAVKGAEACSHQFTLRVRCKRSTEEGLDSPTRALSANLGIELILRLSTSSSLSRERSERLLLQFLIEYTVLEVMQAIGTIPPRMKPDSLGRMARKFPGLPLVIGILFLIFIRMMFCSSVAVRNRR